jgi:DHA2 family multidrug resistance protein
LMGSFAATRDQITWTAVFYFATKLYALLLAARVQERFGQRRSLLGASAALVLATGGSIVVTAYPSLLVVRFFQGAAGGLVLALGQGALLGAFPRREQDALTTRS